MGTSVLQLTVTDRDATHNGPPFTFSIVGGNEDSAFQVNLQGELLAAALLSRQTKDHYLLQIQVSLSHRAWRTGRPLLQWLSKPTFHLTLFFHHSFLQLSPFLSFLLLIFHCILRELF